MPDSDEHPVAPDGPPEPPGTLSSLSGTRPHRRSPKRLAVPTDPAVAAVRTDPSKTRPAKPTTAAPRAPRTPRTPTAKPRPTQPPPRETTDEPEPTAAQGFEADPIRGTVDPPTTNEILSSLAQGATELAEIGLTLTKRLAHTLIDRLPRL